MWRSTRLSLLSKSRRRFPRTAIARATYATFVLLSLLMIIFYDVGDNEESIPERNSYRNILRMLKSAKPQRKVSRGGKLLCNNDVLKPSRNTPEDADHVRPADIQYIGAMGDSFMVGFHSTNYDNEMLDVFPGNSFFTGMEGSLEKHVTVANILLEFNPKLGGISFGKGFGGANLNVAALEADSEDLPRQAQELVDRINLKGNNAHEQWKLIAVFAGLYDLGYVNCRSKSKKEPSTVWNFFVHVENALDILHSNLKRTIVILIPILNPQVLIGAQSEFDGVNVPCWKGKYSEQVREDKVLWFNKMLEKIQYERKFETKTFAVVVKSFANGIVDVIRAKNGMPEDAFYAEDHFHFSKYGNALFATYLWNSLFEPIGKKSGTKNFTDTATLRCPSKDFPYIRTLGNSF